MKWTLNIFKHSKYKTHPRAEQWTIFIPPQNQNLSPFFNSPMMLSKLLTFAVCSNYMSHMNLILAWLVLLPRGNGKFIKMRIMNLIRPCVMNQLKGMFRLNYKWHHQVWRRQLKRQWSVKTEKWKTKLFLFQVHIG